MTRKRSNLDTPKWAVMVIMFEGEEDDDGEEEASSLSLSLLLLLNINGTTLVVLVGTLFQSAKSSFNLDCNNNIESAIPIAFDQVPSRTFSSIISSSKRNTFHTHKPYSSYRNTRIVIPEGEPTLRDSSALYW
eukprot:CAMPEP_0117047708 /NCGR_PEP_ID=MMETSP0472-20121206/32960_1 /TAXON_ID=693140 ORGANISM="Tiarina fusus, Strain LIS" /NCGR_SAMPLE_ID=MMETSP0472 /ASSEMBLY_ACC=CAM_ASM_000603 /LENGTH=132 /DNA_ID=CAMNT_0004760491 /DNA_START=283 /DNA_END=678 /DNA_ORIENTATION=-